jgi:hypothetical protein
MKESYTSGGGREGELRLKGWNLDPVLVVTDFDFGGSNTQTNRLSHTDQEKDLKSLITNKVSFGALTLGLNNTSTN